MFRMGAAVLASLILLASASVGESSAGGDPSLMAGKAALEDGLYELAQKQARAVLDAPDRSAADKADAVLILARALHGQERFAEMVAVLEEGRIRAAPAALAAGLLYWRAMGQYAMGRQAEALRDLDVLEAGWANSPYSVQALRLRAWCELKLGRAERAFGAFAAFERDRGKTDEGLLNLLDWARALMETDDLVQARQKLETLISRAPETDAGQVARIWLAQVLIREKKNEKAWNMLDVLASDKNARADRRAEACYALSELNAAQTNYEAALAVAVKGSELAPTRDLKKRGAISRGRYLLAVGKVEEGTALLKGVITAEPSAPLSARLQLELARTYYDAGNGTRAAEEYQYYLETFTNRAGQAEACSGKGMALFKAGRYAESAAAFEKAWGLFETAAEKAQALLKMGDALLAKNQYIAAADAYQRLMTDYPGSELVPQAMLQCGDSLLRAGQSAQGEAYLRQVTDRYPLTPAAERALFRLAEYQASLAHLKEALAGFTQVLETYTNGALYAQTLLRRGLLLYRMVRFEEAQRDFKRVVEEWKSTSIVEQAYFYRGRCLYMMGHDEQALAVGKAFIEQYTNSVWTPEALFWLGEYQYNHGAYEEAEKQFVQLSGRYPDSGLADTALLKAGCSAAKRKEYLRAIEHFGRLANKYPTSPDLPEARFYRGDALAELGDLSTAILSFEEIITRNPTNELVGRAWIRKGYCQATLGVDDPKRYEEAIESYKAALSGQQITPDLRLEAECRIGLCLEKLDRSDEAVEQYAARVVYRYLEDQARTGPPDAASAVWFTRAAFAAADLFEKRKEWRGAVRILQRVAEAGVPAAHDAQDRIDKIRKENWILFY